MFNLIKTCLVKMALKPLMEKVMGNYLEGIGVVQKISCEKGKIFLTIVLAGLEDRPIDITCDKIEIAQDGSAVTVRSFESGMPFVQAALNRYATRTFTVPPGGARMAVECAKKALNL